MSKSFHPMYNIPETFGKAVSYEGQINAILQIIADMIKRIEELENRIEELGD